jgi:hypothetical protein
VHARAIPPVPDVCNILSNNTVHVKYILNIILAEHNLQKELRRYCDPLLCTKSGQFLNFIL